VIDEQADGASSRRYATLELANKNQDDLERKWNSFRAGMWEIPTLAEKKLLQQCFIRAGVGEHLLIRYWRRRTRTTLSPNSALRPLKCGSGIAVATQHRTEGRA